MKHHIFCSVLLLLNLNYVIVLAQTATRSNTEWPLDKQLDVMKENQRSLVIEWIKSTGNQMLAEKRLRNYLAQDTDYFNAFNKFLCECCKTAFMSASKKSDGGGNPEWAAGIVVLQIPRDMLLSAIVPQLNPGKQLYGLLDGNDRDMAQYLEYQADDDSSSFRAYANYLSKHKKRGLPPGLIGYMIHKQPGKALVCVTDVFVKETKQSKELLWAEHVISDIIWKHDYGFLPKTKTEPEAITQLYILSKYDEWWVRLYVAEVMRQHKAFRQPEIIERLKKDEYLLVRKSIESFTKTVDMGKNSTTNKKETDLPQNNRDNNVE